MRKNFLIQSLHLLYIGLLLSCTAMQGVVNWNNTVVAADVVNDDLIIQGDNQLNGGIAIIASTSDIDVTVNQGDAIVRGTANGPSRLFLSPSVGRTITFDLQNSLSFFGSATGQPLLILVNGGGTVEFVLGDNEAVVFSADGLGGGTKFYLKMEASPVAPATVLFRRNNTASNNHVEVVVGRDSLISYVAETGILSNPQETATITFDPTNESSIGRMILTVENRGGVLIAGNLIDSGLQRPNIFLTNIDMTQPAGKDARMHVVSTDPAADQAGLLVVNENGVYPSLTADPFFTGSFNGFRTGFILGAFGTLHIGENSYVDYVGTKTNTCLHPAIDPELLAGRKVEEVVKARNASAFIVDSNPTDPADVARIEFETNAALFFRSGVDKDGNVNQFDGEDDAIDFTIDPSKKTAGIGNVVFDVEGQVGVSGVDELNRIEILSLHVDPTGGPVRYDLNDAPFVFPRRDFNGETYNSACFLINGRMNMSLARISHTDQCHKVIEKNDCTSEPTYVGGDAHVILKNVEPDPAVAVFKARPKIVLFDSAFDLHTNAGFVGLDIFVPNDAVSANDSLLRFFHNGKAFDDCTGRQLIMGNSVGSFACDGCSTIDRDAHIDIFQETPQELATNQQLTIQTLANNELIHENLPINIDNEFSLHTIYLGWASNISIGTDGNFLNPEEDPLVTFPTLLIDGNYLSFETRGGLSRTPETANVTGQGGIFVDNHGVISITSTRRANVSTMITRSHNGSIQLPKNQVFFDLRVGIAEWKLDLREPAQHVIVEAGEVLSDYTLNWLATTKDYENFTPYDVGDYNPCQCPPVEVQHISSLPKVLGTVDQLQIKGSRIGCPAHLMIDCGWVRELVFLGGCNSGEAPTGVVVLQNEGRVGLGTAHRNIDSLSASVKLGVNGVTVIANGTGQVDLNEDIEVDNICSILRGPDFGSQAPDVLTFVSQCCRTIRVKPTGILDFTSFDSTGTIRFDGEVKIVMEPGSKLVLGNDTQIEFRDKSQLVFEPFFGCEELNPEAGVSSTDARRVRIMGHGNLIFQDDSIMQLNRGAIVGVETDWTDEIDSCLIRTTSLVLTVNDDARIRMGEDFVEEGGVLQIGNTTSQFRIVEDEILTSSITFNLQLSGENATMSVGTKGLFGLAVGLVDDSGAVQNDWLVDTLFNVQDVIINVQDGAFIHNHIFAGDQDKAQLMAFGPVAGNYYFTFNEINGEIVGGGNIIKLTPGLLQADVRVAPVGTAVNPIVLDVDGVNAENPRLSAGVLSSTPLLRDLSGIIKPDLVVPATQDSMFEYAKVIDTGSVANIRAVAGETGDNFYGVLAAYVANGQIIRRQLESVVGPDGEASAQNSEATTLGALNLIFRGTDPETNNDEPIAFQIPQVSTSQR